jgi:hypothetical protein
MKIPTCHLLATIQIEHLSSNYNQFHHMSTQAIEIYLQNKDLNVSKEDIKC